MTISLYIVVDNQGRICYTGNDKEWCLDYIDNNSEPKNRFGHTNLQVVELKGEYNVGSSD